MPGLSQLKQFNSDILSIGDERNLRAARGEKPISLPIPRTVEDKDDSDDFVLGMPEVAEETVVPAPQIPADDSDLSDITGAGKKPETSAAPPSEAAVPDMSDILHTIEPAPAADGTTTPDLSQFTDEVPAEPEPEPEEPSIADLGLDDLLKGGGFDEQIETPPETQSGSGETAATEKIPEEPAPVVEVNETGPEATAAAETGAEHAADDDFSYSGKAIDMNAGLPDEIAENNIESSSLEAVAPEQPVPGEAPASGTGAAPETAAVHESAEWSGESDLQEGPAAVPDFDLGGTTAEEPAVSGAPETETPSADDLFSKTDLDLPDFGSDFSSDTGKTDTAQPEEQSSGETANQTPAENGEPVEKFDTSEIDGLDFNIPDTDSQIAKNSSGGDTGTDFELGQGSEIKDENSDFEIPGFSDTTGSAEPKKVDEKLQTPDFSDAVEGDRPAKNTLSDAQYKKFLENLSEYPLNVRVAVEDLIVKNEFTDDAEFEVINKIINHVPARQIASHLEKMLDISIPVPRDFERRTASEYATYKQSLEYQVRNRIIPAIIIGVLGVLLGIGLFQFSRNFIYRPLKANSLYKQGYVLIQSDEYPQSEIKFNEATEYQLQKKWFYRYARAYREHKQFERAEKMYKNILYCFAYDKPAGIEYAQMECDDLANYPKAEEILKRDVLDNFINDKDGILALGDVYLEWATEKDPTKFENARAEYATLIQLYGQTDLYLSRMMRYFIRTDNLKEVLQLKEHFITDAKSLGAADWTELSGYLLDKRYADLAPADEYLRAKIEDVKEMLLRAIKADPKNPVALYNLSRYYVKMNNSSAAVSALEQTVNAFKNATVRKARDTYKEIDAYRLLGEEYVRSNEYLKAQESYTGGITIYQTQHDNSGFAGTKDIGRLFADIGDIDYFVSGNTGSAYDNYNQSVKLGNDTPSLRYRIGYIEYGRNELTKAVGSFIKASEDNATDNHLLLALGNTLSLSGDDYAAQGYYERLIAQLDKEREQKALLLPQVRADQAELVDMYLKTSNNYGVTLFRLSERTGSSAERAEAMVQLSQSMRAWDALTRNQQTMVRLGGSNLAEQNMMYMSHPVPDYEPALYTELPRTLAGEKDLTR